MKLLGKRSVSTFLKVLLDGAFYLSILAAVLLVVVLALVGRMEGENLSQSLPVFFSIDPSVYEVESSSGGEIAATIGEARGTLTIQGGAKDLSFLPILLVLPFLAVVVVVLHWLRRIFRRLREGRPFVPENARHLRWIGFAVLGGEIVWATFVYWSTRLVVADFTASGVTLDAQFAPRMPVLLAGLVVLVVAEVFREGAQMKSDLETAREIQFSLVPATEFEKGGVSIHSRMSPARTVGGDYYDIVELDDGRIAFVVADVAGKGLPAALLMVLLRGSVRSLITSGLRGGELVDKLNTYLVANTPSNRMVTFFYGELDPATGRLRYVNAGHNPPYLRDATGVTSLDSTAPVLGLFDGVPVEEASVELRGGARLVLFTDGFTEAADPSDEEFGEERLEALVRDRGAAEPAGFIDTAVEAVIRFCGKAKPADDMTMMVVCRAEVV